MVSGPVNGTLSGINQAADTVDYAPDGGFSGADSFDIRAMADGKASNVSTVVIEVQPARTAGAAWRAGSARPRRQGQLQDQAQEGQMPSHLCRGRGGAKGPPLLSGPHLRRGQAETQSDGELVLRFRRAQPLTAGKYTLTVVQRVNGDKLVTKSRVRVS